MINDVCFRVCIRPVISVLAIAFSVLGLHWLCIRLLSGEVYYCVAPPAARTTHVDAPLTSDYAGTVLAPRIVLAAHGADLYISHYHLFSSATATAAAANSPTQSVSPIHSSGSP